MSPLVREDEARSSPRFYREGYPEMIDGVTTVIVSEADFKRLPEYSCSVPTGVCAGKVWKCRDGDGWLLGSMDECDPPQEGSVVQSFKRLTVAR